MNFLKEMTLLILLLASIAQGSTLPSTPYASSVPKSEVVYNEYYTINERAINIGGSKSLTDAPEQLSFDFYDDTNPLNIVQQAKKLIYNLLRWTLHEKVRPVPEEAYIRKLHFGRWINDPTDDTCMNTRAKVLVRDSRVPVTYRNQRECVVEDGLWNDPYTDNDVTSSREIQIDHMVPLKNAYVSGAHQWDYKTRCLYANYMGYTNHLIPAGSRENMSKGDRGPEKYLPPNIKYRCQYVKDWLAVKFIWRLNMTADEAQAIHEVVINYRCDISDFQLTKEELLAQREYIKDNIEFCMINKR